VSERLLVKCQNVFKFADKVESGLECTGATRRALKVVNEAKKKMDLRGNTGLLITQYPPSCFSEGKLLGRKETAWGSNMEATNKLIPWEVITYCNTFQD